MSSPMLVVFIVLALFCILDLFAAFLAYGLGREELNFSLDNLSDNLKRDVRPYNFNKSQVDFILVSMVRLIILFGICSYLLMRKKKPEREGDAGDATTGDSTHEHDDSESDSEDKKDSSGFAGIKKLSSYFCFLLISFSIIKVLALSEAYKDSDFHKVARFWWLFSQNIVFSIFGLGLWHWSTAKIQKFKEESLVAVEIDAETGDQPIQDTVPLILPPEDDDDKDPSAKKEEDPDSDSPKDKEDDDKNDNGPLLSKDSLKLALRLLGYCKKEWKLYAAGFTFLIFYSTARIFIPFYVGKMIGNIVIQHSYSLLMKSILFMAILAVVSAFFAGLRNAAFTWAMAKVSWQIRSDLFASLVKQEIGFFDKKKTGEITSRLTNDCDTMTNSVALNLNVFLRNSVMAIGAFIFMIKLSWQLGLMTLIAMPFVTITGEVFGGFYDSLSKKAQDALAKANIIAEEVISGMRTVRSFAEEVGEAKRYQDRLTAVLNIMYRLAKVGMCFIWTLELFETALTLSALWYGGHLVLTDRLLGENLITFLIYEMQFGENLQAMGAVYTGLMQSVGASRKVFSYIDRKPELPYDGSSTAPIAGSFELKGVSLRYPSRPKVLALNNLSFSVAKGETVALVGPSGGGKSSCISLMEHFYEPCSGLVIMDGVPIKDFDHKHYHTQVALVSQEPLLFATSIRENITYGLEEKLISEDRLIEAAKMANALEFIEKLPKKFDSEVGEKGVQLSGGQKQRVAIARALIRNPKVLLLDEATSALDSESEHLVQEAIYNNLEGRTVLLIAHRLSTVEKSDRIIVIEAGSVVQQGRHEELLSVDGLYKNLVSRQLLGGCLDSEARVSAANKDGTTPKSSKLAVYHAPPGVRSRPVSINNNNNELDLKTPSPSRSQFGSPASSFGSNRSAGLI